MRTAIAIVSCSANPTAVHVDTTAGQTCYGTAGTATYYPNMPRLYEFCAGNNHGSFRTYSTATGAYTTHSYSAGFVGDYNSYTYLYSVTISGWSGSDHC